MFNRLCLIGAGLIGGSIARATKQRKLCREVVAYGRQDDLHNLRQGQALGVLDYYSLDIAEAVSDADCVIIATPVGAIAPILALLKPIWNSNTVYSDVGSTKTNVIQAAKQVFGAVPDNLIPAHPIAGGEQSGIEAAVDDLFVNKRLIITPEASASPALIAKMTTFWQQLGAEVEQMTPEHHDSVFAATSHLPHILAFALVDLLGHKDEQSEIFKYAAGGFRDFTRIATSDPTMWLDICRANKAEIMPLLAQMQAELDKIQHCLAQDDAHQLFNTFAYAQQARQRFLDLFEN